MPVPTDSDTVVVIHIALLLRLVPLMTRRWPAHCGPRWKLFIAAAVTEIALLHQRGYLCPRVRSDSAWNSNAATCLELIRLWHHPKTESQDYFASSFGVSVEVLK